jgi:hypothetical protein
MTVGGFLDRLAHGKTVEEQVEQALTARGFVVMRTGMEYLLDSSDHGWIRRNNTDETIRAVRHAPDFFCVDKSGAFPPAYWECKGNRTKNTANFSIEKPCYEELVARQNKGERIVIINRDVDGSWWANWIQYVEITRDMSQFARQARGSRTDYLLYAKSDLVKAADFLEFPPPEKDEPLQCVFAGW